MNSRNFFLSIYFPLVLKLLLRDAVRLRPNRLEDLTTFSFTRLRSQQAILDCDANGCEGGQTGPHLALSVFSFRFAFAQSSHSALCRISVFG